MPIKVVNRREYSGDGIYIGRPSYWGNPYSHLRRSRATVIVKTPKEAIRRFRADLTSRIAKKDKETLRQLNKLVNIYLKTGELTLICWCRPNECHGDVIAEFVDRLAQIRRKRNETNNN